MRHLRYLYLLFGLTFGLMLATPLASQAQCPQCKSNVESAMKTEGNTVGKGLNPGILYILALPYLAGTVLFILWYRQQKRKRQLEQAHD